MRTVTSKDSTLWHQNEHNLVVNFAQTATLKWKSRSERSVNKRAAAAASSAVGAGLQKVLGLQSRI